MALLGGDLHGRAFQECTERRSRTTYRPTVTPEGSTHVDTAFTGTTSSFSRTAFGRLAAPVARHQRFLSGALRTANHPPRTENNE